MSEMTVTLDAETSERITNALTEEGFDSAREFLATVVAERHERDREAKLVEMLEESLREPAIPLTAEVWTDVKRRFQARHPQEHPQ